MAVRSARSDLVVEEHEDGATLTLLARNALVTSIVLPLGGFVALGPLTLLAYGFSVGNYGTVLLMAAASGAVVWLTWRLGWRPRPFEIAFSRDGLEVGRQRFAYMDIRSYGLSRNGGGAFVPATMPIPRNITLGPHIYIDHGSSRLPITVGLKDAQAREALRLFGHLLDAYRSA